MKKLLALLLAALMIATLCACSKDDEGDDNLDDYIQEEVIVDHITVENGDYTDTFHFDSVDSETVTVTKYEGSDAPHDVVIPDTLNRKTVVGISDQAFYFCSNVKNVTIPATVTSIGEYAFAGCAALESVTIPASVTTIGVGAFAGCSGMTALNFAAEGALKNIEQKTFYACTSLATLTIPAYVETIGTAAFYGCTKLEQADMYFGLEQIGSQAFRLLQATEEGLHSCHSYQHLLKSFHRLL